MDARGTHIICELSGCDPAILTDVEIIRTTMIAAAKEARATVILDAFHRFQPQGVSGVVVIEESHLSIHTWPELGYAAVDFYTCGNHTDPWLACEYAAKRFGAKATLTTEVKRGVKAGVENFTHVVQPHVEAQHRTAVTRGTSPAPAEKFRDAVAAVFPLGRLLEVEG